jgi:diguanylate cyclase (GGDEF)-like protein
MRLQSLRQRIALVFVGLLVLIMALTLVLVAQSNRRVVTAEMVRELSAGSAIFDQLVEQNRRQLETAATVLSGDFAFRAAIATEDKATILSVLRNHGARIGATVMTVIGNNGKLIADTQQPRASGRLFPFSDMLAVAERDGRSSGFKQMEDGRLYQLVLVPILAPQRIAWVAMGFPVNDNWARGLAQMTGLQISLLRSDGRAQVLASSLNRSARGALPAALPVLQQESTPVLDMAGERFQSMRRPLGSHLDAVLQRSLSEAEAPYRALQARLGIILLGGALVFAAGSVLLARRITVPLKRLAEFARLIAKGDYTLPVPPLSTDEIGQLAGSFEHMRTGIAAREQKIRKLAYEDMLTGLPNRTRLLEIFDERPQPLHAAVLVLDLDRFALINDALGHPVGDQLLVEVGGRLRRELPAGCMLARLWGDEFAFLLPDYDEGRAYAFAEKLIAVLREPIPLGSQRVDVSASIGIALGPRDGQDATTLLRRAELAMYGAKQRQCGFAFATGTEGDPPHEQLSLLGEMREALEQNQFLLYYQPKLALAQNRVSAAEALLRWQHPQRGLVPPMQFIPFAEQTGFIREITPRILEQAVAQAARWHSGGIALVVSANLSARDLLNPGLITLTRQLLHTHDLPPDRLCLEITESALMEDPELALQNLAEFAALGVKLSIDDYGVGQASLAYLKTLPVNELKIDQTFVRSLLQTPKDAAIVRSTIALGHALGLSVVAEGAETMADLEWLRAAGCDLVQGYCLAKPMPPAEFEVWLAAREQAARSAM